MRQDALRCTLIQTGVLNKLNVRNPDDSPTTAPYSPEQSSTLQYSPVQPSTAQDSPGQPNSAQYSLKQILQNVQKMSNIKKNTLEYGHPDLPE